MPHGPRQSQATRKAPETHANAKSESRTFVPKVVAREPRPLYVLLAFANPLLRRTPVEIACPLVMLSERIAPFDYAAVGLIVATIRVS